MEKIFLKLLIVFKTISVSLRYDMDHGSSDIGYLNICEHMYRCIHYLYTLYYILYMVFTIFTTPHHPPYTHVYIIRYIHMMHIIIHV
jgi:hypothetical protein